MTNKEASKEIFDRLVSDYDIHRCARWFTFWHSTPLFRIRAVAMMSADAPYFTYDVIDAIRHPHDCDAWDRIMGLAE